MAGNRKAVQDISPKVREAFNKAIARIGNGDAVMGLSNIIEKQLQENPVGMLNVIARYLPQQFNVSGKVEHEHTHEHRAVSDTVSFITEALRQGTDRSPEKSLPH